MNEAFVDLIRDVHVFMAELIDLAIKQFIPIRPHQKRGWIASFMATAQVANAQNNVKLSAFQSAQGFFARPKW